MNELAIAVLKVKATYHFEFHEAIVRRFVFKRLAYLCSKAAREQREAYNDTMNRLAQLDPDNCPAHRF